MGSTKKSTWIGGTAVLAVAIFALAWFVLIAPVVDETATAAADTQAAEDRNVALTTQLDRLKQQYSELDAYKAELATIEKQIPATGATSDFVREIDALAVETGAAVVALSVDTPADVVPAAPTAVAASESESADAGSEATSGEDDGTTAAAPSGPSAPQPIQGFVAVPVTVTALGNPVSVLNFLGGLQERSDRLFLVTGLTGTGQDQAEASGGRPATAEGDLELVVTGYVYVLKDLAPEVEGSDEEPVPPAADGSGAFANT